MNPKPLAKGTARRTRISVLADETFSILRNTVVGHVTSMAARLPFIKEINTATAGRLKLQPPMIGGAAATWRSTEEHSAFAGRAAAFARKRWEKFTRSNDQNRYWMCDLSEFDALAMRTLKDCRDDHAVVIFSQSPEFMVKAARYVHMFSRMERPHIICVTSQDDFPVSDREDLTWLGVRLVDAGDLGSLAADAINDLDSAPVREIDWAALLGGDQAYPPRVRNIALFARPDWGSCGSGTYFGSLGQYFRANDTLIIDITFYPYKARFTEDEVARKAADEHVFIRPAAFFSLRKTRNRMRRVRALPSIFRYPPRTVTNQMLLDYVFTARPPILDEILEHASITQIHLNHYFTYGYFDGIIGGRKFFLDTHDIQSLNAVAAGYKNALTKKRDTFERMIKEEMEILRRAERLSFVSLTELETAKKYLGPSRLLPFIALPDVERLEPKRLVRGAARKLLFVASHNPPNQRNIDWFINFVWPRLSKEYRETAAASGGTLGPLEVHVCGGINKHVAGRRLPSAFHFHGIVDELLPHYKAADAVILPVVTGAGAAMKTIEALLHERPVIGTSHAFRGLPPEIEATAGAYNAPNEFSSAVVAMFASTPSYRDAGARARRGAQILRDQDYFGNLGKALEAVRLPEKYT